MMEYTKDFSVIIPCWRGAIKFLPKLFSSIPDNERIEIIVVDNSKEPVMRQEIESCRDIVLIHSAHERHAGGSRNDGMKVAKGKWLIFADADDYFTPTAFDVFYSKVDSDAELIYTKPDGIYEDSGEWSDRGEYFAQQVHRYCVGEIEENSLRLGFSSPWCKMVKHELVDRENLRYDEIRAGNDQYFSLTSGYFAKTIEAVDEITYIVTVNYGSLTQHRDYEVIKARLFSLLHCNQFLRGHGLSRYQHSIMAILYEGRRFGVLKMWEFVIMLFKFRQNPFIGWRRWASSLRRTKNEDVINKKYIVK